MKFLSVAIASTLFATLSVSAREQCSSTQFYHTGGRIQDGCCLERGGSRNPPSPPSGKACPGEWYWHDGYETCVPNQPNQGNEPQCDNNWPWDKDNQCCNQPTSPGHPQPSHGYSHWKRSEAKVAGSVASRNWRAKTMSCAAGQTVCNVSNSIDSASTWACVDTLKDINFCGGCGGHGEPGQDCSAIPNSWNVGCHVGQCEVFTCEPGYRVSRDGKSCVALE